MYQMPAALWNKVAQEQQLQTRMAANLFRLSDMELEEELRRREEALAGQGYTSAVIVSYLTMAPLLWENMALQAFVRDHPLSAGALPEVLSIDEAVMVAKQDRILDERAEAQLRRLLMVLPV